MHIDPALLSPVSALCGALVGGSASFAAAMYTQRSQQRLQRIASDVAKREKVYAEFVMRASNLPLNAYIRDDIALGSDEQRLVALINRMRLFAAPAVVTAGEAVLRAILRITLGPSIDVRQLATEGLSKRLDPDALVEFSLICRAELDSMHRMVA